MDHRPIEPAIHVAPEHTAGDTWIVHSVQEALGAPLRVYINSLVIRGAEPVLVETGTVADRRRWLEDTFSLVDPADVRYVFISHDDADHTGNLAEVLELCPNATLLASWGLVERHSNAFRFPLERVRWVNPGETIELADRRLSFVRPPVFDSPTTRGVFDHRTGVYWAADCFATPVTPELESTVAELDPDFWAGGTAMFGHHALSPWLDIVDRARFEDTVDAVRAYGMTTIASAHAPLVTDRSIDDAFALVRSLPSVTPPPLPDQQVLDALLLGEPAPAH